MHYQEREIVPAARVGSPDCPIPDAPCRSASATFAARFIPNGLVPAVSCVLNAGLRCASSFSAIVTAACLSTCCRAVVRQE